MLQANFSDYVRSFDCIYAGAAFGYNFYWEFIVFLFVLFSAIGITLLMCVIKFLKRIGDAKKTKYIKVQMVFLSIALIMIGLPIGIIFYMDASSDWINKKFEQKITILAEHISDKEEENLRADFKKMTCRIDYKILNDKIDIYWGRYNIDAPMP